MKSTIECRRSEGHLRSRSERPTNGTALEGVGPKRRGGRAENTDRLANELLVALHDAYAGPLFAFALRLCHDRQRAEEVVQDALLRAWQHPEAVDGSGGSARAWLFTVVRNRLRDDWRRDGARPKPSSGDALANVAAPDDVERAVEAWGIGEAVARLSEHHRVVLYHAYYLGQSVDETALALHVPPGTVKSRTYYALRALRSALEEMGYVQ